MRSIFLVLIVSVLFSSCDDGDIITVDLDFDKTLELCSNNTDAFTIYDLRNDPSESLALILPRDADDVAPFINPTPNDTPTTFTIDGSTNRFIYRTYNRDIVNSGNNRELCNAVIPSDLIIQESYEALGGTAFVTTTIIDDDNDGIPSENEGRGDADENGDFPNAIDTDGDGVPNYQDQDDDNDNVMTSDEDENLDGDDNPFTDALDTDGDGTPNYLDTDDDGDLILTIEEDENGDKNPRNDMSIDSNGIDLPHYLNDEATTLYESPGIVLTNSFTRVVTSTISIINFNLEIISGDEIDFGTLTNTIIFQQEFEED